MLSGWLFLSGFRALMMSVVGITLARATEYQRAGSLPGRLQRRHGSNSRDAGPVNFIDLLSGEFRGISQLSTYQFLEAAVSHALGIEDRIVGLY
jgi:hypothetical protein